MDSYDRNARLAPALLALLPFTLCIAIYFDWNAWPRTLVLLVAAAGLHIVVAIVIRGWGLKRQAKLWAALGGNPTALRLRWSTSTDAVIQTDLHRRVTAFTRIDLPNRRTEIRDPQGALRTYDMAVARLRERTRDRAKYPRVYAELVNYGFARNTLGSRPAALTVGGVTLLGSAVLGILNWTGVIELAWWRPISSAAVGLVAVVVWASAVTPRFVESASNRYAEALLSAADTA